MAKETKELVEPSIVVFGYMLQEAIQDGWRISEQWPVNFYGGLYVVNMERGEDDPVVEDVQEEEVAQKPKRGPKAKSE